MKVIRLSLPNHLAARLKRRSRRTPIEPTALPSRMHSVDGASEDTSAAA